MVKSTGSSPSIGPPRPAVVGLLKMLLGRAAEMHNAKSGTSLDLRLYTLLWKNIMFG